MTNRNKIIYWIATGWLSLGMTSTGIVQFMTATSLIPFLKVQQEADMFAHLGYPNYLLIILGVWKLLGVIAVLVPKFPLLKEWAYAGFFFAMSGAVFSHLAAGDPAIELFGPVLLIVLTVVSWYFRPAERKLIPANA